MLGWQTQPLDKRGTACRIAVWATSLDWGWPYSSSPQSPGASEVWLISGRRVNLTGRRFRGGFNQPSDSCRRASSPRFAYPKLITLHAQTPDSSDIPDSPRISPFLRPIFAREMSNASRATSPIPLSSQVGSEELVPIHPKTPLPLSVVSRLASVIRWYPFLSTVLFYAFLVGGIAGVAKWSYNMDATNLGSKLQLGHNESGVSSSPISLTQPHLN